MISDLTLQFSTHLSPCELYDAINDVTGWWTKDLTGAHRVTGDEFEVQFSDIHFSRQKLVETVPCRKVVWLVTASHLSFVARHDEWTGTHVVFEIETTTEGSILHFTHEGLTSELQCYEACSGAWSDYILNKLKQYAESGVQ